MNPDGLRFFNPYAEIRHTENRLPHWQQEGAVYFATFRVADAVPANLRAQWESERATWLRFHPRPWSAEIEQEYHQRFSGTIERLLDAGHGSCVLSRPGCAQIVWIVMPNHVHLVFVQRSEWPLETLLHSWKRFTARGINQLLGRTGSLWQRDYFDRLVRDEKPFRQLRSLDPAQPGEGRIREGESILYESALALSIE